jgi:potassium-transporting ATPase KdpC subunit
MLIRVKQIVDHFFMKSILNTSIRLILIFTIITGVIYPLVISGISRVFFHEKAEGSLVKKDGIIAGSGLIGQDNDSPVYFWSRPSATGYKTLPSGGSNLSWTDHRLKALIAERKEAFIKGNMLSDTITVPVEMLFASASGLDPHISPRAAMLQANRVSRARNFNHDQEQELAMLISVMTEKPQFSLFGEERVNVFLLNLGLDKIR